jgi:NDP-sugar pyrophosphorylase family protein
VSELVGGIIAAGEGRRLRAAGFAAPKPLVEINGVPLLETVIRNFVAASVRSIVAIVNAQEAQCVDWARARFPDLDLRFIVKTTPSSLASFREVVAASPPARLLVSTVDAWCRPRDFSAFVAAARRRDADATVLAVTPLVADEKPLWTRVGPDGRVEAVGGPAGTHVTAGIYLVSPAARRRALESRDARLRDFLTSLHVAGEPIWAEVIETVVDVDRAEDVALAESLAGGGA